jgi:hypothetical protein
MAGAGGGAGGAGGRSAAELRYGAVEVRMTSDMSGDPAFNHAIDSLGDEVAGMLLDATDEAALAAALSGMDMASLMAGGLDAEAEAKLAESLFAAMGGGAGGAGGAATGLEALLRLPPDALPPTAGVGPRGASAQAGAAAPAGGAAPPAVASTGAGTGVAPTAAAATIPAAALATTGIVHLEVPVPLTGASHPVAITRLPKAMHVWFGPPSAPAPVAPAARDRPSAPGIGPGSGGGGDRLYRIVAAHSPPPTAVAAGVAPAAPASAQPRSTGAGGSGGGGGGGVGAGSGDKEGQLPAFGVRDLVVATPLASGGSSAPAATTLHLPAAGADGAGRDSGGEGGFDAAAVSQRLARRCGVMVLLSHALPSDANTPFVVAQLTKAVESWWSDSAATPAGTGGGGGAAPSSSGVEESKD